MEKWKFDDCADWLAQPPPTVKWIIEGLVAEGENLLIGGNSGVGKSLLRTQLALAFIQGSQFLEYKVQPLSVLIVQHENSINSEWRRTHVMASGLQIKKGLLLHFQGTFDLPNDAPKLRSLVESSHAQIVIYDCLATIHGVDENNNSEMRRVCECLKKIDRHCKAASIVIHHFRKAAKDETDTVLANLRGASSITDYAGNVIILSREDGYFKIRVLKTRDSDEAGREIICERNPNTLKLEIVDEIARGMAYDLPAIREILEDGPIVTQVIFIKRILEAGITDSTKQARNMIKMAVDQRLIYKYGSRNKKTYSLATEYATTCKQLQEEKKDELESNAEINE